MVVACKVVVPEKKQARYQVTCHAKLGKLRHWTPQLGEDTQKHKPKLSKQRN